MKPRERFSVNFAPISAAHSSVISTSLGRSQGWSSEFESIGMKDEVSSNQQIVSTFSLIKNLKNVDH